MPSRTPARHTPSPRYRATGVLTIPELRARASFPSQERLARGPVAIVECVESIPCNPCAYACPRGAITIPGELTCPPVVNFDKCNGCSACIARCPGLAIFVVNVNYSSKEASVTLPYEQLPRPQVGQRLSALDRHGRTVCRARVERVLDTSVHDRCAVVTVAIPKRFWNSVRAIRPVAGKGD